MKPNGTFRFTEYKVDPTSNTLRFLYGYTLDDGQTHVFEETLKFPEATIHLWGAIPVELLDRWMQTLHLAFGISYWKTFCAPIIEITWGGLTRTQADVWNILYTKGLGEFFYRNNIDFRGLVCFPAHVDQVVAPVEYPRQERALVPIGGGKDSLVSVELLKSISFSFDSYSLGTSGIQEALTQMIGVHGYKVERRLDPHLLELSEQGIGFNGHVPISLIYSLVGQFVATLFDYRYVVFSNEASANFGNVEYLGMEVNHQWSKSFECEKLLRDYVHSFVTLSVEAFSLLRPLSEYGIALRFAQHPEYFFSFSSCNRNFTHAKHRPTAKPGRAYWCGECPKCAFVFALLSRCIPKATLIDIFGKNLLDDPSLISLYRELIGIEAFKPFECVGTPEETATALALNHLEGDYAQDAVMRELIPDLPNQEQALAQEQALLKPGSTDSLPKPFVELFM